MNLPEPYSFCDSATAGIPIRPFERPISMSPAGYAELVWLQPTRSAAPSPLISARSIVNPPSQVLQEVDGENECPDPVDSPTCTSVAADQPMMSAAPSPSTSANATVQAGSQVVHCVDGAKLAPPPFPLEIPTSTSEYPFRRPAMSAAPSPSISANAIE